MKRVLLPSRALKLLLQTWPTIALSAATLGIQMDPSDVSTVFEVRSEAAKRSRPKNCSMRDKIQTKFRSERLPRKGVTTG